MKNIMHKYIALLSMIGVVLILPLLFRYVVSADTSNPVLNITSTQGNNDGTVITLVVEKINKQIEKEELMGGDIYDPEGILQSAQYLKVTPAANNSYDLTVNTYAYNKLDNKDQQRVMYIALNQINNSDISTVNKNKIYNFISNTDKTVANLVRQLNDDVSADFVGAYGWFKHLTKFISILLGFITLTIFVLLGFTFVFDLAFIVIPTFQWFCLKDTDGNKKPKFVSIEAWQAVKQAEDSNSHKTPLGVYAQSKFKEVLILGICVLYLVTGEFYTVISEIIDAFSGFLPQ